MKIQRPRGPGAALVIALCAATTGCLFIPQEEDVSGSLSPWRGTITRLAEDGGEDETVDFVGYDPIVVDAAFGSGPTAMGYIDTSAGLLLAYIAMNLDKEAKLVELRPDEVLLDPQPKHNADVATYDVTYIEKIPSGQPRAGEQVFRYDHGQHSADLTGDLAIEDTDHDTFLRGTLTANIGLGGVVQRRLDLQINWRGPKD